MKAAIYARVSTDEQNVETQLQALRHYCQARGWEILNEYVDEGVSGSIADRAQLNLMMQHAANRWFKVVLVWKFDRLFRSVAHMLDALDRFRTLGIDFVSMTEAVDTSTPMGKMVFTFLAGIAEFERALIQERTRAGIARARAEGKQIGRPRVEINVNRALALWNGGHGLSYRKLALELGCSPTAAFTALKQAVLKQTNGVYEQPKGASGENF
jgi:DNA invertase Pin-like site-specific DNA recombinase